MKRSVAVFVLLALHALSGPPSGAAELAWPFENGAGEWTIVNGEWEVEDGIFREVSGATPAGHALVGNAEWVDYTVEAKVRVDEGNFAGLAFRAQNEVEYYVYYVDVSRNVSELWRHRPNHRKWRDVEELGIYKQRFPVLTGIEAKNVTLARGEWIEIKVVVEAGTFRLFVNGEFQAESEDTTKYPSYTFGSVGVWSWETKASFDDVRVSGASLPPGMTVVEEQAQP